jgi:hypothetical protein
MPEVCDQVRHNGHAVMALVCHENA